MTETATPVTPVTTTAVLQGAAALVLFGEFGFS